MLFRSIRGARDVVTVHSAIGSQERQVRDETSMLQPQVIEATCEDTPELVDYFGSLQERGVQRVYAWFCDFAAPDTLAAFGEDVIREFD